MQSMITVAPAGLPVWHPLLQTSTHLFSSTEDRPVVEQSETGEQARAAQRRPRALVVDDVQDVTEMIALFLQHGGYEVSTAFSGPDALEVARKAEFDVIVSDIGMPGMNGYELAQALRALPNCSQVPMIAVTGFSIYDNCDRALACGFNAQLTKPINPMTLLELIERLRH
jgi:CheY-like chemotaxis protein